MAVTPKKKSGGGRKRDAQQQQGGPPKKAKVSRYFLLAPGCTQDDYSKKGAKPGKPRKNDKHLPVDIRWVQCTMRHELPNSIGQHQESQYSTFVQHYEVEVPSFHEDQLSID